MYKINNKSVKVGPRVPKGHELLDVETGELVAVAGFDDLLRITERVSTIEQFPTIYAESAGTEYFAEAVAMRAMGTLSPSHVRALERIVGI